MLEQNEGLSESSREWPAAIKALGSKLRETQNFATQFQEIDQLTASAEKDLATMAIANLRGLQAIYEDIQAENYKQLLMTPKY